MSNRVYSGIYRGVVSNLSDSENRGRITVMCPSLTGKGELAPCEPCIPFAYDGGGDFYLPQIGDTVWIMFEEGDISKPVWLGNWFSVDKTPDPIQEDYSGNSRVMRVISDNHAKIIFDSSSIGKTKLILSVEQSGSTKKEASVHIGSKAVAISVTEGTTTKKTIFSLDKLEESGEVTDDDLF